MTSYKKGQFDEMAIHRQSSVKTPPIKNISKSTFQSISYNSKFCIQFCAVLIWGHE